MIRCPVQNGCMNTGNGMGLSLMDAIKYVEVQLKAASDEKKSLFSVLCRSDNLPCFSHAHKYMNIYFSTIMWNPKTNQFPDTLYARRLIYLSLNPWYLKLHICDVIKLVKHCFPNQHATAICM